jgi:hypothetical protein
LWSPQGLGADDRAGVAIILDLIADGFKPHLIFTTKEEKGGTGAQALIRKHHTCPFHNLKYLIELDRHGKDDCVFYDCENPEFVEYVQTFGFSLNIGTFTDISIICPVWKIAGVNLSVGYEDEHSKGEHLFVRHFYNTIEKVKKMLEDAESAKHYQYIRGYKYSYYSYYENYIDNYTNAYNNVTDFIETCDGCQRAVDSLDTVDVKDGDKVKFLCYECFSKLKSVKLCSKCNDWFIPKNENDCFCDDCWKGANNFGYNKKL